MDYIVGRVIPVGYRGLLNFYEWCYEKGIPVVAVITGGESITYVGSKKVSPGRIASLILIRVVDIPLARMYCTINETTVDGYKTEKQNFLKKIGFDINYWTKLE